MKSANVQDFRANLAEMLESEDAVIITRHGKLQGVYISWESDDFPLEIKREAFKKHRKKLRQALRDVVIDDDELMDEFLEYRKRRRRLMR